MNKQIRNLTLLFWGLTISRFFSMIFLPLADTTEARYANTALMMSKLNDWITPYYDYGVPFWGKPPLSFWAQALSYKLFGIYDFVPRIPSLLITLATIWLIYKLLILTSNKMTALLAIVIYSSMLLVYALSGAVLTDPYLAFSTTLSLVSFLLYIRGEAKIWSYLFFIGLGIGLLAKGPLALVVVGGIITLWILLSFKKRISVLIRLPWFGGLSLMLLISIPWYIFAELKTPGFLNYFIVGEHLGRFLDSGWHGDKYGYVHKNPHGAIWIMWLVASLPWGLNALVFGFKNISNKIGRLSLFEELKKDDICFYTVWMLFIMLFFTMAGNVIWTYILPSLPALAILLALYLNRDSGKFIVKYNKMLFINALFVPVVALIATLYIMVDPSVIKTEKYLIGTYKSLDKNNEPIYFLEKKSFSTSYYMNRKVTLTTVDAFNKMAKESTSSYFVVVNKNDLSKILNKQELNEVYISKKYVLYEHK
jgi:4-amino-4-deoxy-L-arabinose transferase-like glycosyltransferase